MIIIDVACTTYHSVHLHERAIGGKSNKMKLDVLAVSQFKTGNSKSDSLNTVSRAASLFGDHWQML